MMLPSKTSRDNQRIRRRTPPIPLAHQLLIELHDCNCSFLNCLESVKNALIEIAKLMNFTVVDVKFHEYSPHGITGVVIIAESHIAVHTWPEYGYAAVDIFTCGDSSHSELLQRELRRCFNAKESSCQVIKRGLSKNQDCN